MNGFAKQLLNQANQPLPEVTHTPVTNINSLTEANRLKKIALQQAENLLLARSLEAHCDCV